MILCEIWEAVWRQYVICSIDIHDISIDIQDGRVFLTGHVSKETNQKLVEEIARSAPGATAVYNHLVVDHDLVMQVAQAIAADERIRPLILPVSSYHGWITLGGEVPDRELRRAAEAAAGRVPTVRGVLSLPRVAGERDKPESQAVQPEIGVTVYGKNGIEGNVTQVIIQPRNRLVTHAVVRTYSNADLKRESGDYLVPVEAMDLVNEGGIVLVRTAPGVEDFPVFQPANYPYPPSTWQPPYPYRMGSIRWPRLNIKPVSELFEIQTPELPEFQKKNSDLKKILPDQQPEKSLVARVD